MAYLGTTSTAPNVPFLVTQGIAFSSSNITGTAGVTRGAPRVWNYASTHDSSDIAGVNFFTDGQKLGFAVGDILWHVSLGSSAVVTSHRCVAVGSTTTDFGAGTVIGSSV